VIALYREKLGQALAHPGFRRYFANTSWMFGEQALRILSGIIVGIWVTRYLGPERYGIFSYAIAFTSIFGSIAKLGLDGIVVRNLVKAPEKRDAILGTAFWLKLVGATLMLIVVGVSLLVTDTDRTTALYVMIITAGFLFQSVEVIDFYFQSRVLSKFVSLCRVCQLVLSSILKLYFIYKRADLIWFVVIMLIDQFTVAVTLCLAYKSQEKKGFFGQFSFVEAKNMLQDSYPLILSGFLLMVQARADQVLLKKLIGNTELGYYSSALRLIEAFVFVPVILSNSLFPAVVNARKMSKELYETRLLRLYRLMMALFLLVATPIFFFGSFIITILYKNAYAPAGPLFSLMAFRLFFTNYGMARNSFLMAENLTGFSLFTMAAGAVVSLALNFLLIPHYHSVGAIWANIGTFFVSTFLLDFFYRPTRSNAKLMAKSMLLFVQ
jgi:O-antigen/teichoic acid export membrane protein